MKPHVVVIEDDSALLAAISLVLKDAGYRVTALQAIDTLEELIDYKADCFILDEQLPLVSGHIICIMLKSRPETRHIPVIMISGHEELEGIVSLCKAEAFLRKPFADIRELSGLVATTLETI